jgi:putative copper export protein
MRTLSLVAVFALLIGIAVFAPTGPALAASQEHQHDQQADQDGMKMSAMKMAGMQMGAMMEKKAADTERLNVLMAQVKNSTGEAKATAMAEVIALLLEERAAMQDHCAMVCSKMKK